MFRIASLYGIGLFPNVNRTPGLNGPEDCLKEYFKEFSEMLPNVVKLVEFDDLSDKSVVKTTFGRRMYENPEIIHNVNDKYFIINHSYLQGVRYFSYIMDEIRQLFDFHPKIKAQVEEYGNQLFMSDAISHKMCVHVRRTDFLGHRLLETRQEFLIPAMATVRSFLLRKYPEKNISLIFITDDENFVDSLEFPKDHYFNIYRPNLPSRGAVMYFGIRYCDSLLNSASGSTFASWIGLLMPERKDVFYNRRVFKNISEDMGKDYIDYESITFWIYLFHQLYWKRRKLPPGPMPWPIFGNALSLKHGKAEKTVQKWGKTYGDIQTVWFGSMPVITLHDTPTIYETFLKDGDAYADRPVDSSVEVMKGGVYGVGATNGVIWREHRRFALRVFRDFGLGRNLMQERILVEVMAMLFEIKADVKSGMEVLSLQDEIDRAVGSVINLITFGFRFDRSKLNEFKKVKQYAANVVETSGNFLMRIMKNNINVFRRLPVFKEYYEHVVNNSKDCEEFFMKLINDHKKKVNLESDQDPVDYVEAYMKEQYKLQKSEDKSNLFSDKQLYGMVFDLWVAGQETSSTTLAWLFLYMTNRPEMQKKIHEELDSVVGSDRAVTLEDKTKLHYLNAIIAETHRYCNIGSFNVLHRLNKDTVIHGYNVPKGTCITYQLSTINRDTRYYNRPDEFIPERFLDKDGKFFTPPSLLPFGIGKRACLGEGLAKLELYLFSANVFNQMRLLPPGKEKITEERVARTTNCCKPYKCRIEWRY